MPHLAPHELRVAASELEGGDVAIVVEVDLLPHEVGCVVARCSVRPRLLLELAQAVAVLGGGVRAT